MVRECMSAFASFSNWRHRNQPCLSASSTAFASMPLPFQRAGVSTTFAPRKRISLRRSTLKFSAIVDDERIALLRAHHRETDAGVAARRFDDRLAGLERAAALGVLDDAAAPVRSLTEPIGLKASTLT